MNASLDSTTELLKGLTAAGNQSCDVAVFPPFPYLGLAAGLLKDSNIALGAQNCSVEGSGAFTGEVSAAMLADTGCSMGIVGHSERRALFGESDFDVLLKTRQYIKNGMTAVVCVGETLEQRKAVREETVVSEQLALLVGELSNAEWEKVVIAYEPVWAIGTGETATPDQAQAMHAFIRSELKKVSETVAEKTRILYGGSVKGSSAAELFAQPDVDGGLVGGASLDVNEFLKICGA